LRNRKDDGIDILNYWKRDAIAYPTLVMMTRDTFIISASTVLSESCFSSAKMILVDKHTKSGASLFRETYMLEILD
jgi:hAT family C-terminal dimerisation region